MMSWIWWHLVPYIANPDLVERMQNGWPLAESDRATYYGVSGSPEKAIPITRSGRRNKGSSQNSGK